MSQNQSLRSLYARCKSFVLCGRLVRPEGLEPPAYWFEANRSQILRSLFSSSDTSLLVNCWS